MGSLPKSQAGVGSATSDTAMQVGGAIGVGVLGTVLNLRYRHLMAPVIARAHVSVAVQKVLDGSLGGALAVARLAPSKLGIELASWARRSFVSGMDEALLIATAVVGVAALVIMLSLPNRGSEVSEGSDSRADVD
jgi:multisubunit Na+/H+ antiporter MnhC subunit